MNPRILLTATGSGCGKTTITIALLKALSARGLKVASFKCGPDYIDPMYHRKTLGIPAYNLDPFLYEPDYLREVLQEGLKEKDIGVLEGVMGYYDGYGTEGKASTYEVAYLTQTPTILIVNAKGVGQSVGAILRGFTSYRENHQIEGVIFNQLSKGMYPMVAEISKKEGLRPLGYMPYDQTLSLESRHLGLYRADEVDNIQKKIERLGQLAIENLDIEGILTLAREAQGLGICDTLNENKHKACDISDEHKYSSPKKLRLAVARDDAFCFFYQENLDSFLQKGCELVYFSPMRDSRLPEDCQGLYLPGGYPELHTESLSQNESMRQSIKKAIEQGMPTIAECGGYMYLHETLEGCSMVGVIPGMCSKQARLVRFGYGTMKAKEDNLLLKKGETLRIHEFHYYDSEHNGDSFVVTKASNGVQYECAYATSSLYAGYPHLHLGANPNVLERYMEAMQKYQGISE